jgi:type II secretory pathway component PulM
MFRKLMDRVSNWWESISHREKRIVLAAGGIVVALIFVFTIFAVSSSKNERETRLSEKEQKLIEIIRLRNDYKQAESGLKMIEMRLKGNSVNLFSFIEDLARRMQVEVSDMNERTSAAEKDSKIKEVSVEVNINKVTQDRLMEFLSKLEKGPEIIKITRLRMRTRFEAQQRLIDANVTISTFKAS